MGMKLLYGLLHISYKARRPIIIEPKGQVWAPRNSIAPGDGLSHRLQSLSESDRLLAAVSGHYGQLPAEIDSRVHNLTCAFDLTIVRLEGKKKRTT